MGNVGVQSVTVSCLLMLVGTSPCDAESTPAEHDGFLLISVTLPSEEIARQHQFTFHPSNDIPAVSTEDPKPRISEVLSGIAIPDDTRLRLKTVFAVPGTSVTDFSTMSVEWAWIVPIIDASSDVPPAPPHALSGREQIADNLHSVSHGDGNTMFVFLGEHWAILSEDRNLLAYQAELLIEFATQAEPTEWPMTRLHVDRIPEDWREYLGRMSVAAELGEPPLGGRLVSPLLAVLLRTLAHECDAMSMKAYRPPANDGLTVDFRVEATTGSSFAEMIDRLRSHQARLAGLASEAMHDQDAWLNVYASLPRFDLLRSFLRSFEIRMQFLTSAPLRTAQLSDSPFESPLWDFDAVVQQTINATIDRGEIELLISLGALNEEDYRDRLAAVVLAGNLQEVEQAFLDVAAATKPGSEAAAQLDTHLREVDEASIHSFLWPASDARQTRRAEFFAVTGDAVFATTGEKSLEQLEQALAHRNERNEASSVLMAPIMVSGEAAVVGALLDRNSSNGRWEQLVKDPWNGEGRFSVSVLPEKSALVIRVSADEALARRLMISGQELVSPYISGHRNGRNPSETDEPSADGPDKGLFPTD